MNEKRFRVQENCLRSSYGIVAENWLVTNDNYSVVLNDKAEAHMVANMFNDVIDVLNALHEEKGQLKSELKIYRNVANCGNCKYHTYDWFDDSDEFEVCEKGNDVTEGICEEWEEL